MLGNLVAAQFDLEKTIAELNRKFIATPGSVIDQLAALATLQRQIGTASGADLAELRSNVIAAVAATQSAIQDGRIAVADANAADGAGVSGNTTAARQQIQSSMAAMQRFSPYLRFASPEDQADYERREAQRRAYIEAELAKGTPGATLNANAAAIGQLLDAGDHGADASPDFQAQRDGLTGQYRRLQSSIRANGGSTRAADDQLDQQVRELLRRRGKTDQEIDAIFAANGGDPLKVIDAISAPPAPAAKVEPPPKSANDLDAAMAALRTAGVSGPPDAPTSAPYHGLVVNDQPAGEVALT